MTCQMMDPSFLLELSHYRVNERIACLRVSPFLEEFLVDVPFNLLANAVVFNFIEVWCEGPDKIEELPPENLSKQGNRWLSAFLVFPFDSFQLVVKLSHT